MISDRAETSPIFYIQKVAISFQTFDEFRRGWRKKEDFKNPQRISTFLHISTSRKYNNTAEDFGLSLFYIPGRYQD